MSILEVKNLSHGFGDRAIFENVSFRLLKGEHIGLVGANGEGKSTFMSIVTGKLQPDEGKVEWSKYVTAGYLDQHAVLEKGMTVRDVLRTAFDELFKTEERINKIYMSMAEEGTDVDALMEEVGELQDRLETRFPKARSAVKIPDLKFFSIALIMSSAASDQPIYSKSIQPDKRIEQGLALS